MPEATISGVGVYASLSAVGLSSAVNVNAKLAFCTSSSCNGFADVILPLLSVHNINFGSLCAAPPPAASKSIVGVAVGVVVALVLVTGGVVGVLVLLKRRKLLNFKFPLKIAGKSVAIVTTTSPVGAIQVITSKVPLVYSGFTL